jgi:two-component system, NtrC family, sensor histidine kinase KinB
LAQALPYKGAEGENTMFNLRQKLSIGFGGLLVILVLIGSQGIYLVSDLGQSIDVILRENYSSVIACQDMKEALERMDSGALFCLLSYVEGNDIIRKNQMKFEKALNIELNNITVPGEGEKAQRISSLFSQYRSVMHDFLNVDMSQDSRRNMYFKKLFPLFQQTKQAADEVLHLNQQNMSDANDLARAKAASARQQMGLLLFVGAFVAVSFIVFTRQWILYPISRLIQSADEIKKGNLDLCIQVGSRDEIGQLSEAFNDMVQSLREFRRSDQAKLALMQLSTQQAFKNLPDITAIVDMDGTIDAATELAGNFFGLRAGSRIQDTAHEWIRLLYDDARSADCPVAARVQKRVFQVFVHGNEHFIEPHAVPVLDTRHQATGVLLSFKDVTQQQHNADMKRGLVATVSHQLKTPLTSIRMAIHLLLEEKVGELTEKQAELLLAAREDSDRLNTILEDLLDISRIESGKAPMSFTAVAPEAIAAESVEHFAAAFQDRGISLKTDIPTGLPEVMADITRIVHVFDNLLSNALKHTAAGGSVAISAHADEQRVIFSVFDTGAGIPREYLSNIFEQFFRVPGQQAQAGAGLGLAIAREIVEAHGGKITVESTEGEGSTFTVSLKRAEPIAKKEQLS